MARKVNSQIRKTKRSSKGGKRVTAKNIRRSCGRKFIGRKLGGFDICVGFDPCKDFKEDEIEYAKCESQQVRRLAAAASTNFYYSKT